LLLLFVIGAEKFELEDALTPESEEEVEGTCIPAC
jgi:hypothetical protein